MQLSQITLGLLDLDLDWRWPGALLFRWFKAARVVEQVFDKLLNNESCDKLTDVGALRHLLEVHFTRQCHYDVDIKHVDPALLKK